MKTTIMIVSSICYLWSVFVLTFNQGFDIAGEYRFYNSDSTFYHRLRLFENSSYYYEIGGDLFIEKSSGKWYKKGDSLFLNSSYKKDEKVNIIVHEDCSTNKKLEFQIEDIDQQKVIPFGIVLYGRTNSKFVVWDTMPFYANYSNLDSFKIVLNNRIESEVYHLKDLVNNKFKIALPSKNVYQNYLFLDKKKFLIQQNGLLSIKEDNKVDSLLWDFEKYKPVRLIKIDF